MINSCPLIWKTSNHAAYTAEAAVTQSDSICKSKLPSLLQNPPEKQNWRSWTLSPPSAWGLLHVTTTSSSHARGCSIAGITTALGEALPTQENTTSKSNLFLTKCSLKLFLKWVLWGHPPLGAQGQLQKLAALVLKQGCPHNVWQSTKSA